MNILVKNVDTDLLDKQREELVILLMSDMDHMLWGLVDMLGDMSVTAEELTDD